MFFIIVPVSETKELLYILKETFVGNIMLKLSSLKFLCCYRSYLRFGCFVLYVCIRQFTIGLSIRGRFGILVKNVTCYMGIKRISSQYYLCGKRMCSTALKVLKRRMPMLILCLSLDGDAVLVVLISTE